jgi:hypothetical protein
MRTSSFFGSLSTGALTALAAGCGEVRSTLVSPLGSKHVSFREHSPVAVIRALVSHG